MTRQKNCAVLLFVLTLLFAFDTDIASAQTEAVDSRPINYEVDLSDVRNHYVTVRMTVPADGLQTELMMAVWTPGSYLVREYARHVDSIVVQDYEGNKLDFRKTRKNRWTVDTDGLSQFTFQYRVYCNELTVRTNFVNSQFAVLNGAPTLMTVPGNFKRQHVVKFQMPDGWTRIATSLRGGDNAYEFVADSFDEIVDSPVVAGMIEVFSFESGGVEHKLVNAGDSRMWDGTQAASDLKQIVQQHQRMWGEIPYDRYLFLNVIGEGGGGLEHDNSCLLVSSRWSFRERGRYVGWLSLCSHEFFHTWNVRRLRPKSLVEYDYENEVYTRSLWVAEGVTSYYEDLMLARGGIMSGYEFFNRLTGSIQSLQTTPGRKKQSLTESSYDTWIKFYRPDENSSNTRVSYYNKGTVVAFLLDSEIRSRTDGEKSLDDLMRGLYSRHSATGYTEKEFRDLAGEIAGADLTEWFRRAVDSTEELDYSTAEEWFGLAFEADERAQREARIAAREERRAQRQRERAEKEKAEEEEAEDETDTDDFESEAPDSEADADCDESEEKTTEADEQDDAPVRAPEFDMDSPWIGASVSQ